LKGSTLLFHLLSKLYEQTSVIITTNLIFSQAATSEKATAHLTGFENPASLQPESDPRDNSRSALSGN
jgi:hypothetical protein